jgi:hypothetical protein
VSLTMGTEAVKLKVKTQIFNSRTTATQSSSRAFFHAFFHYSVLPQALQQL